MTVSIAVPVRDEERTIEALLESLLAQTRQPDEIVVVDGGSTDRTADLVRKYAKRGVRLLQIGPAYPGRGRNAAIRATENDWVAFIDAGCLAEPNWLAELLVARERLSGEAGVVLGNHRPILSNEWDVAQALAFVAPEETGSAARPPSIASSLLHRSVWEQAGGFPEQLRAAEDLVFFRALEVSHVPTVRSPGAVVLWRLSRGPMGVFRRFRLYSNHHLRAGLFRTWHLRVMAMDCCGLGLATASVFWPPALVICLLGAVGRLLRTVARRRRNIGTLNPFRPDRLLRAGCLLFLADAALWAGTYDYCLGREHSG